MLGNNFLKNNLISFEMLNLNSNFGLKNLLTNNIKKIAWTKPATDTPYDKKTTNFSPKTFPATAKTTNRATKKHCFFVMFFDTRHGQFLNF